MALQENQNETNEKLLRQEECLTSNSDRKTCLLGKRKQEEATNGTTFSSESQDIEFESVAVDEDVKLENVQLKQSLLLLVLGAEQREEWPEKWQNLVWKVVNQNILQDCSNSTTNDSLFNEEFTRELESYFPMDTSTNSSNTNCAKEWVRNRIKPCLAFNSLLEPISKKIKIATTNETPTNPDLVEDDNTAEEASPIF